MQDVKRDTTYPCSNPPKVLDWRGNRLFSEGGLLTDEEIDQLVCKIIREIKPVIRRCVLEELQRKGGVAKPRVLSGGLPVTEATPLDAIAIEDVAVRAYLLNKLHLKTVRDLVAIKRDDLWPRARRIHDWVRRQLHQRKQA